VPKWQRLSAQEAKMAQKLDDVKKMSIRRLLWGIRDICPFSPTKVRQTRSVLSLKFMGIQASFDRTETTADMSALECSREASANDDDR
jgi:hypothetical protein